MNDVETIFNDLLDSQPNQEIVNEANDQTIKAGTYRIEVTKKEVTTASDKSPWPGRLMIHVAADAYEKLPSGDFQRRGKLFFDLSPIEGRYDNGKLDGPTKLWANMVKVAGPGKSNREIFDMLDAFPLRAYVTRPFKKLDGGYASAKTEDEEKALFDAGGVPKNFIQNLGPWTNA